MTRVNENNSATVEKGRTTVRVYVRWPGGSCASLWGPKADAMSRVTVRYAHSRALLLMGLPWFLTAASGTLYSLLSSFGVPRGSLRLLMQLHQFSFFGTAKKYYPLAVGGTLIVQTLLGCIMLYRRLQNTPLSLKGARNWHVVITLAVAPLLVVTALAGIMYRVTASFREDRHSAHWWITLHTGELFGLHAVWPPLVGGALMAALVTGFLISPLRRGVLL